MKEQKWQNIFVPTLPITKLNWIEFGTVALSEIINKIENALWKDVLRAWDELVKCETNNINLSTIKI